MENCRIWWFLQELFTASAFSWFHEGAGVERDFWNPMRVTFSQLSHSLGWGEGEVAAFFHQ